MVDRIDVAADEGTDLSDLDALERDAAFNPDREQGKASTEGIEEALEQL